MNKYTIIKVFLPILFLFLFSVNIFSEEHISKLDSILVTAEKAETKEEEVTKFATIVTSEELKQTGAYNLAEALRRVGGFGYKALSPTGITHGGMSSELNIRGVYGGELVLINGFPVQLASSKAYDLDMLSIEQIERVEVIKGAASTLYGADAMSGVINIITKKSSDKLNLNLSSMLGDYQYNKNSLDLSYKGIDAGFSNSHLGDSMRASESFTKKYHYNIDDENNRNYHISLFPLEGLSLDFIGADDKTAFLKINEASGPNLLSESDQEHHKYFFDTKYQFKDFTIKGFYYNDYLTFEKMEETYSKKKKTWDKKFSNTINNSKNYGGELNYKLNIFKSDILLGSDLIHRNADYSLQYGKKTRDDYSLFLQVRRNFIDALGIVLGLREQYINGHQGADNQNIFLPSLGGNYKLSESIYIFANSSKAFKAPTFNNLYYSSDFLVGNPKLEPELGWTYDLGFKFYKEYLKLKTALFFMDYEDKIELDKTKGYPQTYYNASNYESKGLEWESDINPFYDFQNIMRNIYFSFSGFWCDPTAEDSKGEIYQIGPKLQFTFSAYYDSDIFDIALSYVTLSHREKNLRDSNLFNLSSKFKLTKHFDIFLDIDNIFNDKVDNAGDRESSLNNYVYYGMDRFFKFGVNYKF